MLTSSKKIILPLITMAVLLILLPAARQMILLNMKVG
jgi:hypothetical protein